MSYAITRAGPLSVPFSYALAANESFRAESIAGTWVGTGASGSFIPCVAVYSQDGLLLGRYKGDATVSAGDTGTEATFGPFTRAVSAASSSSGVTIERAFGLNFASQSVNAGTTKNCSFTTVRTSDATKIQWSTTTVLNDTFKITSTGWAQIVASCQWPTGTLVDYRIDSPGGFELYQHDAITAFSGQGVDFTVGLPTHMDSVWIDSTAAAGTQFRLRMTNNDGVNSGPDTAMVAIMFYPGLSL